MWKEAVVTCFNLCSPGGNDENTETSRKTLGVPAENRTLGRKMAIKTEGFRLFPHSLLANSEMA
jgi:hypothetical protein